LDAHLIITFSATMSYVLIGLFMGLAYGSGEGDIRESYPGKLTSLDALITGKLFSRNVSRSYLIGLAMGGWLSFLGNWSSFPGRASRVWRGFSDTFDPMVRAYSPGCLRSWWGRWMSFWLRSSAYWSRSHFFIADSDRGD
jgi:hypothetical protein